MSSTGPSSAPGDVNAHTHIYSGLAPLGMPEPEEAPETFVQILERVWWQLDLALDPSSLRAAARFYIAEALLAGTTTLIDHHESPRFIDGSLDVLADTCDELGIRAVLCYGATERNGGRGEARAGLAECRRFILANRRPTIRGLVGLHASFTVSDDTIREAGRLCRELRVPLHVHLAEAASDVEDARSRGYAGPLERLIELDALPEGSLLAHGVHLTEAEVRLAARRRLWLLQNPRSNHGNGVGYPSALRVSDRVAVGTDGYPSDLAAELHFLNEMSASEGDDPRAVDARAGAGRRLVEEIFGAGSERDSVVRQGGVVTRVTVGDRVVVEDGVLVGADLEEIRTDAAREAHRLWKRMRALRQETQADASART